MNQQEFKVLEKIASNLGDINSSIKSLTDQLRKINSNTNKNTMMAKTVESIDSVADAIESLKESNKESITELKRSLSKSS